MHGQDAGADTLGRGDLITEDGAGYFIYDKPDIGFHTTNLDIDPINYEFVGGFVVIRSHKGTDNSCSNQSCRRYSHERVPQRGHPVSEEVRTLLPFWDFKGLRIFP